MQDIKMDQSKQAGKISIYAIGADINNTSYCNQLRSVIRST